MEDVIKLLANAWDHITFIIEENYKVIFNKWIHFDFPTFLLSKLVGPWG